MLVVPREPSANTKRHYKRNRASRGQRPNTALVLSAKGVGAEHSFFIINWLANERANTDQQLTPEAFSTIPHGNDLTGGPPGSRPREESWSLVITAAYYRIFFDLSASAH